jgi:tripartite-type tricarboxylate transporter receptor subunit TctC
MMKYAAFNPIKEEAMEKKLSVGGFFFLLTLSVLAFQIVHAQEFPTRPVTLVIPVGAGGSHDLTARAVTSVAPDYLGQPVIIQLKPGGGGAIGSDFVSKATPDGYTLLFGGVGFSSVLPAVEGRSKGPDDLVAVCRINHSPSLIVARADAPYKTFKEMIAWGKANPGKIVFASSGPWGAAETPWKMIMHKANFTSKIVPFDGGGPGLVALLGGHVDIYVGDKSHSLGHIKTGKLRALAVMDEKRERALPDVPTGKETGVDVVFNNWRGVLVPKGTPRPIIDKLAAAFKQMTEDKSVRAIFNQYGEDPYYIGTDEFAKIWRAEYEDFKELRKIYKGK